MGVQLFEHARNGPLDDGFHIHFIDIKPRKVAENLYEFLKLLCVVRILRREGQNAEGGEYDKRIGACCDSFVGPRRGRDYFTKSATRSKGTCCCSPVRISLTVAARASSSCDPTITT